MVGGDASKCNLNHIIRRLNGASSNSARKLLNFGEWYSFSALDNFDSDYLISTLTWKIDSNLPHLWTSVSTNCVATKNCGQESQPSIVHRQAEAIFNLSQLMFALYHGSVYACTFRDLQCNSPPRDIRKYGFNKIDFNITSGAIFRQSLHALCWNIAESGGLPVIFSMMRNPVLPIIRQKALDALTNILCVDNIEKIVLERQPWFLECLVGMVSNGDLQCDIVPAISVLDRLVVVILSEKMVEPYQQLMKHDFIDVCLSRLNYPNFTHSNLHLHFVKFQTITMQAIALLCADEKSIQWSSKTRHAVFSYAFRSLLLWNTHQPLSDPVWHQSESFYHNLSFSSSALLFLFTVIVHALLKWPETYSIIKNQILLFKFQLSKILTLHELAGHDQNDFNGPIILNAVTWIWQKIFATKTIPEELNSLDTADLCQTILEPLPELCEEVLRTCSSPHCSRKHKYTPNWKVCINCGITCYCSEKCYQHHKQISHNEQFCSFLSMKTIEQESN